MFSAAIFDMDGLLIDSERTIMAAWIYAARVEGVSLSTEEYLQVVGKRAEDSDAILISLLGGPVVFRRAADRVVEILEDPRTIPRFPLKPGAAELLAALRFYGVPCAVASSSKSNEIRQRLSSVGVLHLFDAIAGGEEVLRGKPDPAIYELAAVRLGIDPLLCIAFEDSENGAAAALAAGLRVVVVPDIKLPCADISTRAFNVLSSLHEALAHVPVWFKRHKTNTQLAV
jgi:HAD superfamily hydrolase (TIGR01509 family)